MQYFNQSFAYRIFFFAIMLFVSACKKNIDTNVIYTIANFSLTDSATTQAGAIKIKPANMQTGITNFAASQGFSVDKIKSIKLTGCILSIYDTATSKTDTITFNYFDNITTQISSSSLPTITIGSKSVITQNKSDSLIMNLNTTDDFTPYFKSDIITYQLSGHCNKPISHNISILTTLTFKVNATVKVNQ